MNTFFPLRPKYVQKLFADLSVGISDQQNHPEVALPPKISYTQSGPGHGFYAHLSYHIIFKIALNIASILKIFLKNIEYRSTLSLPAHC